MQQWYKCPRCGKDILYATNPCPYCNCSLAWSQQGPMIYLPPVGASQQPSDQPTIEVPQQPAVQYSSTDKPDNEKAKAQKKNVGIGCVAIIIAGIVIFAIVGVCSNSKSQTTPEANQAPPKLTISEIKSRAITIPYDDLMRHNEQYVGQIVYYRGKLVQVVSSYGDVYTLRLATKQTQYLGYSDDIVWINYNGERLLEKDIVDVWGKVKGLQAYSALFGNQVTIPEIDALFTELVTKGTD